MLSNTREYSKYSSANTVFHLPLVKYTTTQTPHKYSSQIQHKYTHSNTWHSGQPLGGIRRARTQVSYILLRVLHSLKHGHLMCRCECKARCHPDHFTARPDICLYSTQYLWESSACIVHIFSSVFTLIDCPVPFFHSGGDCLDSM